VQEVRAGSKKLVVVLICVPPSCSASVRQSRAAMAGMRAARLTRRQDAGNRFSASQAPVAAAIVRADAERGRAFNAQLAEPRAAWAQQPRGYAGPIGPAPVQPGGPPLLIGGNAPAAFRRLTE